MEKTASKIARKTVTVRVSPATHAMLKAATKFKSITIQAVIAAMVEEWVADNYVDTMEELDDSDVAGITNN